LDLSNLGIISTLKTMKVDITFDDSNEKEYSSAFYGIQFSDWVAKIKNDLPYLTPLVLILKRLLYLYELNIPYYGTYQYIVVI